MKFVQILLILYACSNISAAQDVTVETGDTRIFFNTTYDMRPGSTENPVMTAIRLKNNARIILDGFLDEDDWLGIPVATAFTQRFPNAGQPASEQTEVKILYTDQAIYVGFMAYDSAPDSILAPLFRRDGNQPSDWVYVSFDSYDDHRTGFSFAVNPRGVQKDILLYDDSNEDIQWDAVWEAKTQILENGWSAEIRIPLSQLRFSSAKDSLSWGVNFQRRIARKGEMSFWAPTSQNDNRIVSKFGRLNGIHSLEEPRRLEIMPYAAGSILRTPETGTGNPFYSNNQFSGNIGGDIRYGITSNFTLTGTINPDFGQVEADPSVINLTANESFFSERRPFFLEGSDIFRFGRTKTYLSFGNPLTFYSRRIGRVPQGSPSRAGENAQYTDIPDQTTIAGALKISGKTDNGWSIGALNAFTLQENARFQTTGGTIESVVVEPSTNYLVTRIKKDFNKGDTFAGGFLSAVNRNINDTYFENFLRSSAYLGGMDFEHNFGKRNWAASGTFSFSSINGTEDAISLAQRAPARYFNRVDSEKLNLDTSKTNMSGYATELSLQKHGGSDRWLGSVTYSEVSPGYETNDLGFQNRADYRALYGGIIYRNTNPTHLQNYESWIYTVQAWNFDSDRINNGYGAGGFFQLKNLWSANIDINHSLKQDDDRRTRSGPVVVQPTSWRYDVNINSNQNKTVSFNVGVFQRRDQAGGYINNVWSGINVRPAPWLQIRLAPEIIQDKNMAQFILSREDENAVNTYQNRYVFAEIKQVTLITNISVNWTFSPSMSLQTYFRPFISSGSYSNFKELSAPRSFDFDVYGVNKGTITKSDGYFTVDPDLSGQSSFEFSNPDFNFRSIQGNAILRWEYRPGSTLFLVWQQQRDHYSESGNFNPGRDFNELFHAKPTNVFLVKASYWFGS